MALTCNSEIADSGSAHCKHLLPGDYASAQCTPDYFLIILKSQRANLMCRLIVTWIIAVTSLACIPDSFAMRPMGFLEKCDLSELVYIRMYSEECGDRKINWGTILDPEGLPHEVRVNITMGKNFGIISQITASHIEVMEGDTDDSGGWVERSILLAIVEGRSSRERHRYEEDAALDLLGKIDESGKQLKAKLIKCRQMFEDEANGLNCFDSAVGVLF